jgi:hypothetical protein
MNNRLNAWPRYAAMAVCAVMLSGIAAAAQVSIGIAMPGLSIGINVPAYPQMVRVPDYPVYYAPGLRSNYFFYDGLYWIYQGDEWYVSDWYNGPWGWVQHEAVPLFILRVPVGYYRMPPPYFRGWQRDAPPRWGEHWGPDWQRQRGGWDQWNRHAAPPPAPLPTYQRPYSGDRYPQPAQQQSLRGRNYTYQPRDEVARQHYRQPIVQATPAPSQRARPVEPARDQARSQSNAPRSAPPQQDPVPQSVDERRAPSGNGGAQGQANAPRSAQPQRETAPANAEEKKAPGGKSDTQGPSNAQHGAQSPRDGSASNGEQKKPPAGKESNGEKKKSSSGKGSGQDGKPEHDGSPQRDGPQSNADK